MIEQSLGRGSEIDKFFRGTELFQPILDFNMSSRVLFVLYHGEVSTFKQIRNKSKVDWYKVPNCGKYCVEELMSFMKAHDPGEPELQDKNTLISNYNDPGEPELQDKNTLLSTYLELDGLDRTIVQLIAVFYEPVSRSMLAKLLLEMGLSPTRWRKSQNKTISKLLDPLVEKKVLESKQDGSTFLYFCQQSIEWEVVLDAKEQGLISKMDHSISKHAPAGDLWQGEYQWLISFERYVRVLRFALLSDDDGMVIQLIVLGRRQFLEFLESVDPITRIINNPNSHQWFGTLSSNLQWTLLSLQINRVIEELSDLKPIASLINALFTKKRISPELRHWKVVLEIISGHLDQAEQLLNGPDPVHAPLCLQGWLHVLRGDNKSAILDFEKALSVLRKATRRRETFLMHPSGLFLILALLDSGNSVHIKKAEKHLAWLSGEGVPFRSIYETLLVPLLILDNQRDAAANTLIGQYTDFSLMDVQGRWEIDDFLANIKPPDTTNLTGLFLMLGFKWTLPDLLGLMKVYLVGLQAKARSNGHFLIAEAVECLLPDRPKNPLWDPSSLITYKERWEYALESLESQLLDENLSSVGKIASDQRLVWLIDISEWSDEISIQPKVQKQSAKGKWSKGRNGSLNKLHNETDSMPWLTAQDLRVCSSIGQYNTGWGYKRGSYEIDSKRALLALVGHPLVFWKDTPDIAVEVVQSDPGLQVNEEEDQIRLTMTHPVSGDGIMVIKESINRCIVIQVRPEHVKLSVAIGSTGLVIPVKEKERVQRLIGPLSSQLDIQTNLSGVNEHLPEMLASTMPHIHLQPQDEGLMMRMLVRPFGDEGPYHLPGQGSPTLIAEIAGQRQQTHRDLAAENTISEDIIQSCPSIPAGNGDWRWSFDDPESCLELLLELREVGDRIAVLWPEGETLKVSQTVNMEHLCLKTSGDNDWFHVEGKVQLPDGEVIEMKALLEAMSQKHGRFVPLGNGQFLSLTRTFKKRLEALKNFAEKKGRGQRYHHLMLPAINELVDGAGSLEVHDGWQERLNTLEKAQAKKPRIPRTFEAELRPYQAEGFKWMSRLAAWGAGACLADDMGLGKTLQSLALLITRAADGPALVLAPTSVCMNWMTEAQKFAPTLNMIPLGSSGDRDKVMSGLKPFDVLVCSYTMLQLESERLQSVEWQTVVLDEAQAIKNPSAKRTKAALGLSAQFRLATTGTPIENHLLELWSLFRFLNPGLLGSKESFSKRFAAPIERGDTAVRDQLKRILNPFILRRLKNQVLDDLPPKTEITLHVTQESEEAALYEALRQRAMEKLSDVDADDSMQRLNILAEIMQLRRACCHPSLVVPEKKMIGAKLEVFSNVVEELRDNGHRALVFSQFVGHLAIIRSHLDEKQIPYQYLDGSTPAKKRHERVNDFQNGEGDLFLISLKAGGFGLNLTGADYVIHMDPWWNPAVEDQASDRAHRIGQTRPVTIYRLVTENTIEEKIVELHHRKRDLANNLLDGTHKTEKLSTEMLLQLIRE
jgi:superfamily II DNA or RNA helicase